MAPSRAVALDRLSIAGWLRAQEVYGDERWEGLRLRDGRLRWCSRWARGLGDRLRLGAPARATSPAPASR